MKRVIVQIDRLVLNGFRREDRHAIAQGLREELGRLLAEPGAAAQWESRGDLARIKVGAVRIGSGSKPDGIGRQVARGIAREVPS